MLACDGKVHGAVDRACEKRIPRAARRSRFGVVGLGYPYALSRSARTVSSTTSRTFGAPRRRRSCCADRRAARPDHIGQVRRPNQRGRGHSQARQAAPYHGSKLAVVPTDSPRQSISQAEGKHDTAPRHVRADASGARASIPRKQIDANTPGAGSLEGPDASRGRPAPARRQRRARGRPRGPSRQHADSTGRRGGRGRGATSGPGQGPAPPGRPPGRTTPRNSAHSSQPPIADTPDSPRSGAGSWPPSRAGLSTRKSTWIFPPLLELKMFEIAVAARWQRWIAARSRRTEGRMSVEVVGIIPRGRARAAPTTPQSGKRAMPIAGRWRARAARPTARIAHSLVRAGSTADRSLRNGAAGRGPVPPGGHGPTTAHRCTADHVRRGGTTISAAEPAENGNQSARHPRDNAGRIQRAGKPPAPPSQQGKREGLDARAAAGVVADTQRGIGRNGRTDVSRRVVVAPFGDRKGRRSGTAVRGPGIGRARGNEPQEPGGSEVRAIGRQPLDRHRDQEDPRSGSGRSPVHAHHVRAALARKLVVRIHSSSPVLSPLSAVGLDHLRQGSGVFSVNELSSRALPIPATRFRLIYDSLRFILQNSSGCRPSAHSEIRWTVHLTRTR